MYDGTLLPYVNKSYYEHILEDSPAFVPSYIVSSLPEIKLSCLTKAESRNFFSHTRSCIALFHTSDPYGLITWWPVCHEKNGDPTVGASEWGFMNAQFVSRHSQLVVAFLPDTMVQGSVISPHLLSFLFEPLKGLDTICVQWKQTLMKATL